jgi:hypothetical protein
MSEVSLSPESYKPSFENFKPVNERTLVRFFTELGKVLAEWRGPVYRLPNSCHAFFRGS